MRFFFLLFLFSSFCFAADKDEINNYLINQFYNKSVSQEMLDKIWHNEEFKNAQYLYRFQIVDQKLYADSFEVTRLPFIRLFEYFQKFVKLYKVPDVDFIIYGRDEVNPNNINYELLNIPAFMMSKNLNSLYEKDKLLMPDGHILRKEWSSLINEIKQANLKYEWNQKEDKIFWRGATTGSSAKYPYNISNFDKFPRLKLIMLSKLYPDLIDAKFNRYPDFSEDDDGQKLRTILKIIFGSDDKMTKEEDHLGYKYLIAIDGNTSPWVRIPWIMLSNSVLLKQESKKIQWFYPGLKPYIHYVPVQEDLRNIFTQVNWMKNHDIEIKQISLNAQNFVLSNLTPDKIDQTMLFILKEYSKIQKDKKIVASLPSAEDVISVKSFFNVLIKRIRKTLDDL